MSAADNRIDVYKTVSGGLALYIPKQDGHAWFIGLDKVVARVDRMDEINADIAANYDNELRAALASSQAREKTLTDALQEIFEATRSSGYGPAFSAASIAKTAILWLAQNTLDTKE